MIRYLDLDHDSGIVAYEYGESSILIRFKDGATYEYTSGGVGSHHLENMKRLADAGEGLNAYINTHHEIRNGYSRKL